MNDANSFCNEMNDSNSFCNEMNDASQLLAEPYVIFKQMALIIYIFFAYKILYCNENDWLQHGYHYTLPKSMPVAKLH